MCGAMNNVRVPQQTIFIRLEAVRVQMTTESASRTSVYQYIQDVGGLCVSLCVCVWLVVLSGVKSQ